MSGISDRALKTNYAENRYKYNGIEYDSTFGLDEYEAHFRDLDPQTGRWWQIDPQTEGYENISPYASMYDDPTAKSDPLGDEAEDGCCKGLLDGIAAIAGYVMSPQNPVNVKIAEGTRQVLISAGSTLNGALNTVSAGAWSTDPSGTLGIPSETNPQATMVGQIGMSLPIDGVTGGPHVQVPVADGVSVVARPTMTIPGLPSATVHAADNSKKAAGTTSSGHPTDEHGNKLGPSGKPQVNTVTHSSRKQALNAARQEGQGAPVLHNSPKKGERHFHATDSEGDKVPNSTHHEF
jgi:RHS repeat-associated protein